MTSDNFFSQLADSLNASVTNDWRARARPAQLPPPDFGTWLLLSGRGFGKSWAGANYTCELAASGAAKRIALLGPTADHVRMTMVEGVSGILAVAPAWCRPTFEASKGQLTWPSGAIATLYSGDTPEVLRGPEHDFAWCDELAAWRRPETWDNLLLTMRIGSPKIVVTTTPRPTRLIRDLVAREGTDGIVITRGSSYENRQNLAPAFFAQLVRRFEGTRAGRQELLGELLTDTPGSLFPGDILESTRVDTAPPMARIVIGIDPAGSTAEGADETGIIIAGVAADHAYILGDLSGRMAPPEWARKAIDAFHMHRADRLVVEINFGGAMCAATIAAVDPGVPVKTITSSRGKVLRAEPVAALFEQGRAHLVGSFPELEAQMTSFTTDFDRSRDGSPDRVDALVFASSELLLDQPLGGYFSRLALLIDGEPAPMPARPEKIYATMMMTDRLNSALGTIFWARSKHYGVPITILDYDLVDIDAALSRGYFASVQQRASELCEATQSWWRPFNGHARAPFGIWVEHDALGPTFLRQGMEEEIDIRAIPEKLLLPSIDERATGVKGYVASGRVVKLSAQAHERVITHRGVSQNHLLSQILGFEPGSKDQPAELVNCFCAGIALALESPGRAPLPIEYAPKAESAEPVLEETPSAEEMARQATDLAIAAEIGSARARFLSVIQERVAQGLPLPATPASAGIVVPARHSTLKIG